MPRSTPSLPRGERAARAEASSRASPAASSARLRKENAALEARVRHARILQKAVTMAAVTHSFDEALARCIRLICQAAGWPVGHAYLPADDGTGELAPSGIWHWRGRAEDRDASEERNLRIVTARTRFARGVGLPGRILESGRPAWIPDIRRDSNFLRSRYRLPIGVMAAFGFPILYEGRVAAVLEFFSREPRAPEPELIELMAALGEQVGRVLERLEAGERLRYLSRRLIEVQEEERRRVARELHDGVLQVLSSARFALGAAIERQAPGDASNDLARALSLLAEGVREIRAITRSLRPSALEHLGLEPALRALCADSQTTAGVAIRFAGPRASRRLPAEVELALYRIAQEALANVLEHAGASRCEVRVRRLRNAVELRVEDDGAGFDPCADGAGRAARGASQRGLGLVNIRERAAGARGVAEIVSRPGEGTRVSVRVPVSSPGEVAP